MPPVGFEPTISAGERPKTRAATGTGRDNSIYCPNMEVRGMQHVWGRGEAYTEFWWGNLREDSGVDGRIILRWIFRKCDVGVWIGSSWLRVGTGGGHL
jgi:hypothetical protein